MGLTLKYYFLAFVVFNGVYEIVCQCITDRCDRGMHHVCASENTFLRCDSMGNSIPGTIYECPPGFTCVHTNDRCAENTPPFCMSQCSKCNATIQVACLSKKDFVFCIQGKPVLSMNGTCTTTKNCVSSNPVICAADTVAPSCYKDMPEKPTEPTPTGDPTTEQVRERCRVSRKVGKFSSGNCKKYFYCFVRAGEISGNIYSCPGVTQFNCKTQQCELTCDNNCQTI